MSFFLRHLWYSRFITTQTSTFEKKLRVEHISSAFTAPKIDVKILPCLEKCRRHLVQVHRVMHSTIHDTLFSKFLKAGKTVGQFEETEEKKKEKALKNVLHISFG